MATRETTITAPGRDDEVKDRLLCGECEERFNKHGESEVLRWMAPKAKPGASPLHRKVQTGQPVWRHPSENVALHTAESLGMNPEAFAYFVMSLVWRAAVHAWRIPGSDQKTTPIDIGELLEPTRLYLLDKRPFPDGILISMTVCEDADSQKNWAGPCLSGEVQNLIVLPAYGLLFRVWFGAGVAPEPILKTLFYPGGRHRVLVTHCWDVLGPALNQQFPIS